MPETTSAQAISNSAISSHEMRPRVGNHAMRLGAE